MMQLKKCNFCTKIYELNQENFRVCKYSNEWLYFKSFCRICEKQVKTHLESQFESWMNWSNWGQYKKDKWDDNNSLTWTWSIDHIIPQSDLPCSSMEDENFKKCWSLENLRPLSAKQNCLDGASKVRHTKFGNNTTFNSEIISIRMNNE